jgi:hypothetical protein
MTTTSTEDLIGIVSRLIDVQNDIYARGDAYNKDAQERLRAQSDSLWDGVVEFRDEHAALIRERDAARASLERLRESVTIWRDATSNALKRAVDDIATDYGDDDIAEVLRRFYVRESHKEEFEAYLRQCPTMATYLLKTIQIAAEHFGQGVMCAKLDNFGWQGIETRTVFVNHVSGTPRNEDDRILTIVAMDEWPQEIRMAINLSHGERDAEHTPGARPEHYAIQNAGV